MVESAPPPPDFFCCELSQQQNEPMPGTAVSVKVWLLLEYIGPWRARATEDNDLPRSVQRWLDEQLGLLRNGRLQFIKQQMAVDEPGIRFFVAVSHQSQPLLYQFRLHTYQELFELDIPALVAGNNGTQSFARTQPLYLVCSNGKRDRCCAKYGLSLYEALAEEAGSAVWQTTHLGGHRFAPTLVSFPDGTYYGRLRPHQARAFVSARQRGEIYLDHYRGRTCYTSVEQVADFFLRRQTGQKQLTHFHHRTTQKLPQNRWRVQFVAPRTAETHRIVLVEESEPQHVYASCDKQQTKAVPRYRVVNYEMGEPPENSD